MLDTPRRASPDSVADTVTEPLDPLLPQSMAQTAEAVPGPDPGARR
jgi:hypothetical protein